MAFTYTGKIRLTLVSALKRTLGLSEATDTPGGAGIEHLVTLADGTGADKAQTHWSVNGTLAGGANVVHNLNGGVTNLYGTVTFTELKICFIRVKTLTSGTKLRIGGGTDAIEGLFEADTQQELLGAGGVWLRMEPVDGIAVAAGACNLKLENLSPSVPLEYEALFIGEGSVA